TPNSSSVEKLRRTGHIGLRSLVSRFSAILGRYGADISARARARSQGQRGELLPGELQVGNGRRSVQQQAVQRPDRNALWFDDGFSSVQEVRGGQRDDLLPPGER